MVAAKAGVLLHFRRRRYAAVRAVAQGSAAAKSADAFGQLGFFESAERHETEDRFVVITTAANDSVAPVHDRMPLIVERRRLDDWLYDDAYAKSLLVAQMPMLDCVAAR